MTTRRILIAAWTAIALGAQSLSAQQPNASAAAFGMAGNYTALARGYDAVAWNPALLGMSDAPRFSLSLLSVSGLSGLDPVSLADISAVSRGTVPIPDATKEAWLQRIGAGTQRGRGDADVSVVAISTGPVAFQLGATVFGEAKLNQDAAEAILFGNAGRAGSARDLHFNGSNANGGVISTGAMSVAIPLPLGFTGRSDESFSLGVTGKYLRGAGMMRAADDGSSITSTNVKIGFPIIYSPEVGSAGSGVGVDVGLAWHAGGLSLGATAQNVFNSFAWDTTSLRTRAGSATFDGNVVTNSFDELPYAAAPASLRQAIAADKLRPVVGAGVAYRMDNLTVSADARQRMGDGIDVGPAMHAGVGAEYRGLSFLPLRAGAAVITGGWQAAGGLGLHLGPYEIGAGVSMRTRDGGSETGVMVSLVSIR